MTAPVAGLAGLSAISCLVLSSDGCWLAAATGRRSPRPVASIVMPRCSKACLLNVSGESHAAKLAGKTRMPNVSQRPRRDRESGCVQVASAQHSGGVSRDAMRSASRARSRPAAKTPGRKAGCRNFAARPVRWEASRIALHTPSERDGIQRVNNEVMASDDSSV